MKDLKQRLPSSLIEELETALSSVAYGSIEIFVQDKTVTQITVRNIKKTSLGISKSARNHVSSSMSSGKSKTITMSLGMVRDSKTSVSRSKKVIHPRINSKSEVQV